MCSTNGPAKLNVSQFCLKSKDSENNNKSRDYFIARIHRHLSLYSIIKIIFFFFL
jgi:hypothetical protein